MISWGINQTCISKVVQVYIEKKNSFICMKCTYESCAFQFGTQFRKLVLTFAFIKLSQTASSA